MSKDSKTLFTRPASGLVRELSTTKSTFYSIGTVVGNGIAMTIAYVALYTQALVGGLPILVVVMTIAAIPTFAYLLCLMVLTHTMPRSGGDYVFTSRITSPFLGWIEGWMMIWAIASFLGFLVWAILFNLGAWFKASSIVLSIGWFGVGDWITQTNSMLALGVVVFLLNGIMSLVPSRRYHLIFSALTVIVLIAIPLQLAGLAGVSSQTFAANVQKFTGMTPQSVIDAAKQNGWDPTWFSWNGVWAVAGYALFGYTGFTFATYLGGELKGNVQKNVLISNSVALLICLGVAWYILPFYSVAGYDFLNAWAYLFWNAPSLAPMQTAPLTTIIALIARPDAAIVVLPAGLFVLVLINWLGNAGCILAAVRVIFAQAMDRLLPKKLADLSRTNQPVFATIFVMILGYAIFAATVLGVSPAATLWYSVLASTIGFILFPAINVILLKWRRPDIYQMAPPWSRRMFLGLPAMAWCGIVWLAFLVPTITVTNLWSLFNTATQSSSPELLSYIFSSGLVFMTVLILIGAVYYFARKYYLSRQGIELDMIFKALPPE